jgi:predicted 2-oxoglutarate/Fe(II)-dependent dioxygenase YbiX
MLRTRVGVGLDAVGTYKRRSHGSVGKVTNDLGITSWLATSHTIAEHGHRNALFGLDDAIWSTRSRATNQAVIRQDVDESGSGKGERGKGGEGKGKGEGTVVV